MSPIAIKINRWKDTNVLLIKIQIKECKSNEY